MDSKFVALRRSDLDVSRAWALRVRRALKMRVSPGNARAAQLTSHGIGAIELTFAKLAEIAFCRWAWLDENRALRWDAEPDDGTDVEFEGLRWDIKYTPFGHHLIWPYNKVESLELGCAVKTKKKFNTFVLVRGVDLHNIELVGWCTRRFFEEHCERVPEGEAITKGTLKIHANRLYDLSYFDEGKTA